MKSNDKTMAIVCGALVVAGAILATAIICMG